MFISKFLRKANAHAKLVAANWLLDCELNDERGGMDVESWERLRNLRDIKVRAEKELRS
jgi:hypothetical protein